MDLDTQDPVWYLAYGSNLLSARFGCYLAGGRPPGARRTYAGCRDRAAPRRDLGVRLAGGLTFAGASSVWGGGLAFYDPEVDGQLAARAYLVTFGQFSDVVAQEARRPVGNDLRLAQGLGQGLGLESGPRRWPAPSGAYETVLHVGDRDGFPMLTITSVHDLVPTPPSAPYLHTILAGLAETFEWTAAEGIDYLMRARGMAPTWTARELGRLGAVAPGKGRKPA